ncbi:ATP-dependent Clp protease ATP-binding subunit CLPT1, chloroplastic-like isoform X2 [Diospyros lotus]|uniref:ATP-dependent Clp protease ATP-binding subunit CLPT1, chloroplastic-like isoform X2 n=1 Tax=Diospyros lotus TaxID=55363 RepID=UPI002253814F|nr:ATP-dependent Clp protease ATP-binding subunit CLPT1, chloroplastic-like isoform X2 [Diospyros lotus]
MATNTMSALPIPNCFRRHSNCSLPLRFNPNPDNSASSLTGNSLSIRPANLYCRVPKHRRSTVATVLLSLPTMKQRESAASEKVPKWSARAIKSFAMAELEARKLKYPNTGTEALLTGILVEGTSLAAKFLRENGIMLFKVREEIVKLLGKSDMYFFSPEHPPLTEPAQRALDWAVDTKLKSGNTICGYCCLFYGLLLAHYALSLNNPA